MTRKNIQPKYKDLLHVLIIIAILMCYAYYENNKKITSHLSLYEKNLTPENGDRVLSGAQKN